MGRGLVAKECQTIQRLPDLSKRWPLGLGTPGWWGTVLAGVALFALGFAVDGPIAAWAKQAPREAVTFMKEVTRLGESDWILYPSLALFVAVAVAGLLVQRRLLRLVLFEQAWLFGFIFAGVALPSLLATILKSLVGRGRPNDWDETSPFGFTPNWLVWSDQSFPSGHTTTIFALAMVIGFISARWFWAALSVAAMVGASRIVLQMHYTTDVLGGIVLGTLGAYFVRAAFSRARLVFDRRPDGSIQLRPATALRRFLTLRRRGSARVRRSSLP